MKKEKIFFTKKNKLGNEGMILINMLVIGCVVSLIVAGGISVFDSKDKIQQKRSGVDNIGKLNIMVKNTLNDKVAWELTYQKNLTKFIQFYNAKTVTTTGKSGDVAATIPKKETVTLVNNKDSKDQTIGATSRNENTTIVTNPAGSTPGAVTPAAVVKIDLYDNQNVKIIDSVNSRIGFNNELKVCDSFNAQEKSTSCPYRYELSVQDVFYENSIYKVKLKAELKFTKSDTVQNINLADRDLNFDYSSDESLSAENTSACHVMGGTISPADATCSFAVTTSLAECAYTAAIENPLSGVCRTISSTGTDCSVGEYATGFDANNKVICNPVPTAPAVTTPPVVTTPVVTTPATTTTPVTTTPVVTTPVTTTPVTTTPTTSTPAVTVPVATYGDCLGTVPNSYRINSLTGARVATNCNSPCNSQSFCHLNKSYTCLIYRNGTKENLGVNGGCSDEDGGAGCGRFPNCPYSAPPPVN
jgi:hypothetical protein